MPYCDLVLPNLYAGAFPRSAELIPAHIHVILNLSREASSSPTEVLNCHLPFCYWELRKPIYYLNNLCNFIYNCQRLDRNVLVHCRLGLDRTGIVILGFLVLCGMNPNDAIWFYLNARRCRPPRNDAMVVFWDYVCFLEKHNYSASGILH